MSAADDLKAMAAEAIEASGLTFTSDLERAAYVAVKMRQNQRECGAAMTEATRRWHFADDMRIEAETLLAAAVFAIEVHADEGAMNEVLDGSDPGTSFSHVAPGEDA